MTRYRLAWLKAGVIAASLLPFALLVARAFGIGDLGANAVQEVLHTLGKTALNLLLITLAVTPLRRLTGLNWLVGLRRSLGLLAFAYAVLHLLTYAVLDRRLEWSGLIVDVTERPYITVGFLAVILMVPLAVTSTNSMQRRLGRRWVKLHRSVYAIAALGVLHFFWQVKLDTSEPLLYAGILAILLGFRLADWARRRALHRLRQ
jgi:sulfoxide reductase heme-binding subunit YedZ